MHFSKTVISMYTHEKLFNGFFFFRSTGDSSYFYLYRISYMWYSLIGFLLTFVLGLLISNLSRLFIKNQKNHVLDTNLFFPVIARRIRYRRRRAMENAGRPSLYRKYSLTDINHEKDNAADKICTRL